MWDHSAHSHKMWKIARGVPPNAAKTCLFLSPIQRGFSDTYSALISTMFETTDVNLCAVRNFRIFA